MKSIFGKLMSVLAKIKLLGKVYNIKKLKGEDALANQVAMRLTCHSIEGKLLGVWFHVPNETVVSKNNMLTDILRIKRKHSMGLINGVPDLVFISKEKTIFIELKTATGRLSESQILFQEWCIDEGISYYVARSVDEVEKILRKSKLLVEK